MSSPIPQRAVLCARGSSTPLGVEAQETSHDTIQALEIHVTPHIVWRMILTWVLKALSVLVSMSIAYTFDLNSVVYSYKIGIVCFSINLVNLYS